MLIASHNITNGFSDTDATSYATASITPTGNRLVFALVCSTTRITADPNIPTASGNGITWVQVATVLTDDTSSSRRRMTLLRGLVSSPSAGVLTFDFAGQTQTSCCWVITEFSGVSLLGTNGSGAVRTPVTYASPVTSVAAINVQLAPFASVQNATYAGYGNGNANTITAANGLTMLDHNTSAVDGLGVWAAFQNSNNIFPGFTFTSDPENGMIAVELVADTSNLTLRSSAENHNTTGTAVSVTAPAGASVGDLIVISVHCNGNTTIVDNNGSTPFTTDLSAYSPNPSSGHTVAIFSRVLKSGDPTTFNFTIGASGRWSIIAAAWGNARAVGYYDVSPSTANAANRDDSTAATIVAPSITTKINNAVHIACGYIDDGATAVSSQPSGYTVIKNTTDEPQGMSYKLITSAGATGTTTYTSTGVDPMIGLSFSLKSVVGASLPLLSSGK